MSEENVRFTEKFETIEQTLKYIADSQAKSEWLHKQDQIERRKFEEERRKFEEERRKFEIERLKFEEESKKRWARTQKQLDYITKLTGIAFEDIMFQDEKINEAGEILTKKNPQRV